MEEQFDVVEKPEHYNSGKIQTWDGYELMMTDEEYRGAMKGNIYKYLHRYQIKGGVEDLKKAKAYLERLIKFESGNRIVWYEGKAAQEEEVSEKDVELTRTQGVKPEPADMPASPSELKAQGIARQFNKAYGDTMDKVVELNEPQPVRSCETCFYGTEASCTLEWDHPGYRCVYFNQWRKG